MKIRLYCTLLFVSATFSTAFGQNQKRDEEILENKHIDVLTKMHVAPTVIITKIKNSKCKFDVSTFELLQLTKDSVNADVISEMIIAEKNERLMGLYEAKQPKTKSIPQNTSQPGK